jgi:hypothetical protein
VLQATKEEKSTPERLQSTCHASDFHVWDQRIYSLSKLESSNQVYLNSVPRIEVVRRPKVRNLS